MLQCSTPELALGALFGSELTAAVFARHLTNLLPPNKGQLKMATLRRDLRAAMQQDIDHRTGSVFRLNETEHALDSLCGEAFLSSGDLAPLDAAFEAVLEFSDTGVVQFKDIYVQRYAQLLAELDPTVVVAWQLARRSERKGHGKQADLRRAVDGLRTLFVGPRFDLVAFAENHVHLNGVTGNELVVAQLVLGQTLLQPEDGPNDLLQRIRRIRRVLASLVDLWKVNGDLKKEQVKEWKAKVLRVIPDVGNDATPDAQIDWDTIARGIVLNVDDQAKALSDWLIWKVADAASRNQFQFAWIWLFLALWRTYRSNSMDAAARAVIVLVVADVMVLRRQLMLHGNGLRRFTTMCFASPLRDVAKRQARWEISASQDVTRRLFARRGDKAAVKVGLDTLRDAWLPSLARDAHVTICEHEGDSQMSFERSREHWHLCAHFNRVKREQPRQQLWESAKTLRDYLYSDQSWQLTGMTDDGGVPPDFKVLPSQLIRGLDVVGDEMRWPIERFAPMLRWLRSAEAAHEAPLKLPEGPVQRSEPRLYLSIHAGEDYSHPLSGLRHVDETVDFCKMRNGDRLGHALALGIPPDEWLKRHGEVTLPLDEHVDNLVWAWHEATQLSDVDVVKLVLPRLKTRIERLLPYVSWYPSDAAVAPLTEQHLQHLHEAWALRRNCPYKALLQAGCTAVEGADLEIGAPDWVRIHAARNSPSTDTAEGLYVLRAYRDAPALMGEKKPAWHVRVTVPQHGHVTRRQRDLENRDAAAIAEEGRQPNRCVYDHDDAADLRFMLALQDACLERYAKLGLSIEANPTSNVYIGQLLTHSDHPIYRWNPPNPEDLEDRARFNQFGLRFKPMPVTINTDDPGMLPTTLRMEHHLMHEAAIDRGYTEQESDAWIDMVRQFGLSLFNDANK